MKATIYFTGTNYINTVMTHDDLALAEKCIEKNGVLQLQPGKDGKGMMINTKNITVIEVDFENGERFES
jgi:hypothetical protein